MVGKLRRLLLRAPLLLPLIAVTGGILDSWCWGLAALAFLAASVLRLWRISFAVVLCGMLAWLHGYALQQSRARIDKQIEQNDLVVLQGTVEKTLRKGFVLGNGFCELSVLVRGENDLSVGDKVKVLAEPTVAQGVAMPGLFHAENWKRGLGIAAECHLVRIEERSRPFSLHTLRAWGLAVRESLANSLMPAGTEAEAERQILCALVLGARERAEEEVLDDFRRGGCLHAFAVSGLHVGLFSAILLGLLRLCRSGPGVARWLVLAGVGAYVLMTGASVPALRAYLLLVVMLGALILRRRFQPLNTWCFAALLVLLITPHQLFNAGFQLSFAVYGALCIGLHICMKEAPWFSPDSYIPLRLLNRWERAYRNLDFWLRGVVIVSLSAWIVATPITILCFHTFNTWSVLTNIAITPILPVVMCCGLLHLALGWIPWLGLLTDWLAVKSAGILLAVVSFFGSWPAAWLPATAPAGQQDILVVGCGFGRSFTVLGNPGLVINPGNSDNVQFSTYPALFHSGFAPAAILQTRPSTTYTQGAAELHRYFPDAELIRVNELMAERIRFHTPAGDYMLFFPPPDFSRSTVDNCQPLIRWQGDDGMSVLYVGNAPTAILHHMPPESRHADILILGENAVYPLSAEDVASCGARCVIVLPGVSCKKPPEADVPAVWIEMRDKDWIRISPEGIELNGSQWSVP